MIETLLDGDVRRCGRPWLLAGMICLLTFAAGCSLQQITIRQTADVFAKGKLAMDRESDPEFARQALPANIKTIESLLVSAPENEQLLGLLAESYFSYAFGFLEHDITLAETRLAGEAEIEGRIARAVNHHLRARDYGFRLLGRPEFRDAALEPDVDRVESMLSEMDEGDVAPLFWIGNAWGSAINLAQQDPDLVAGLPAVEAIMKRVLELDPSFYYSGAHVFFGVYYADRPPMAGGDPDKAKKHFEAAMERHGDQDLMIPFLYGRYWGEQTQDREFFDKMMDKVLEADLSEHPDTRLRNEIARKRAKFWKEHADDLFY